MISAVDKMLKVVNLEFSVDNRLTYESIKVRSDLLLDRLGFNIDNKLYTLDQLVSKYEVPRGTIAHSIERLVKAVRHIAQVNPNLVFEGFNIVELVEELNSRYDKVSNTSKRIGVATKYVNSKGELKNVKSIYCEECNKNYLSRVDQICKKEYDMCYLCLHQDLPWFK